VSSRDQPGTVNGTVNVSGASATFGLETLINDNGAGVINVSNGGTLGFYAFNRFSGFSGTVQVDSGKIFTSSETALSGAVQITNSTVTSLNLSGTASITGSSANTLFVGKGTTTVSGSTAIYVGTGSGLYGNIVADSGAVLNLVGTTVKPTSGGGAVVNTTVNGGTMNVGAGTTINAVDAQSAAVIVRDGLLKVSDGTINGRITGYQGNSTISMGDIEINGGAVTGGIFTGGQAGQGDLVKINGGTIGTVPGSSAMIVQVGNASNAPSQNLGKILEINGGTFNGRRAGVRLRIRHLRRHVHQSGATEQSIR
jgi:hypothetical protein